MQKKRAHIFNAGPAALPVEVLNSMEESLFNFRDTGMSILEISHRSWQFEEILNNSKAMLAELLEVPDTHEILFATGGATQQFSMVPMNLLKNGSEGNYIVNGIWGEKAFEEAKKYGSVHLAGAKDFKTSPGVPDKINLSQNPSYLHFTPNETIEGVQFQSEPNVGDVTLIADASSEILGRKIDVSKYGIIYAGAQKNLGPSGVTIVIIRKDLVRDAPINPLPILLDYRTYIKTNSLYNTSPVFAIFGVHETLKWVKNLGGVREMEARNRNKASLLYSVIDKSSLYQGIAEKDSRSFMNVTFRLKGSDEIEKRFIKEASNQNIVGIKGHKLLGGIRASLYNAVSEESVKALCSFMEEFEKKA